MKVSKIVLTIQEEEKESTTKTREKPKTTTVIKQLGLTLENLDKELAKGEPSDERLEFLFNKINILEAHI